MIIVKNISKKYGKKQILNNVSFEAGPGQIISIVGNNGCGKTTLLQIISGALKADSGNIMIFNNDAIADNRIFTKYVGFVPQENLLFEELKIKDNISFWTAGIDKPDKSVIDKCKFDIIMNDKVNSLSGGMKRRLSIACIMARKSPIIVLDEPTSSLDMYYQEEIWNSLIEFKNNNGIVIISTHDRNEIKNSDVCYLFDEGKLIRYNKQEIDIETINTIIKNNSIN